MSDSFSNLYVVITKCIALYNIREDESLLIFSDNMYKHNAWE